METQDAIRSVVENIPGNCQLKPELEECLDHILNGRDVVDPTPDKFGKSLIYQLLLIVCEKLGRRKSGKVIIVIVSPLVALMDDQVKEAAKLGLCAAQLGVHNDQEIMEGNFSLVFGIRILDSQSKMASYVGINPIPRQPRRHCCWRGTRRIQMVSLPTRVCLLTSTS